MSRTNRLLGGLGAGYFQLVLVMLVGLWLTPFLLGRLGQHDYGGWLVLTQIIGYLGLLDIGVVAILPRETAAAVGRGGLNSPEIPALIGQTIQIVLRQTAVVAVCAMLTWILGRLAWRSAQGPLGLILVCFVILFPSRILPAILQGLQDLTFLARVQTASWALSTLTSVLLVLSGRGIMALALAWPIVQIATTAGCWYRLKRRYPGALPKSLGHIERGMPMPYMKKSAWTSVSQVAQILNTGTDLLLIGKILGPSATVPYACTGKLASVLANKPQMLMQAAFPGLAELRAAESKSRIRQASMALSQAMLAMSGGVACVVLAVNRGFVEWWIGPNQYGGGLLSLVILIGMVVRHWNTTFIYALFCYGHERRLALTGIADGCVSTLIAAILISFLGPIGAALGMLIGTCLINIPANLIALGREMETTPFALLASSFGWFGRFFIAGLGSALLDRLWFPHGFMAVSALGLSAITFYFLLILPTVLRDPLGMYVKPRFRLLRTSFQKVLVSHGE